MSSRAHTRREREREILFAYVVFIMLFEPLPLLHPNSNLTIPSFRLYIGRDLDCYFFQEVNFCIQKYNSPLKTANLYLLCPQIVDFVLN